jgi:undecaprenyl diphosphate synthase
MSQLKTIIPTHVAMIMDGNRRWAKERGIPKFDGHRAGVKNLGDIVKLCAKRGIKILTIYALSTENWLKRSKSELSYLMRLFREFILRERDNLNKEGVKFRILGDVSVFPENLKEVINETIQMLVKNSRLQFNVALNYGGRKEIVRAFREISKSGMDINKINEEMISQNLYTRGQPDPDLIIRTGGEQRLSNFLIWQASYAELYFTPVFWPGFNEKELDHALEEYSQRQRRFGG